MYSPEPGHLVADRYQLLRKLGQGGMGTVWVAEDRTLRRNVAVKMVSAHLAGSSQTVERFKREAQALARLRSPHVVEVHDFGVHRGSPFMVMELLEGEDLAARLERCGRLHPPVAAHIITQMAKALAAAHAAGIVHRDLKPANVFLVPDEGADFVKIFDFGIAKAFEDASAARPLTQEGSILGTPAYMSPEQLRDSTHVDHRGDLWSLAVIAYRALTGERPFRGKDIGTIVLTIVSDHHPLPSTIAPDLPAGLDGFFERALAKDSAARFQSARSFAAELSAAVNIDRPSSASHEWPQQSGAGLLVGRGPGGEEQPPVSTRSPSAPGLGEAAQGALHTMEALQTSLSLATSRRRARRLGLWVLALSLIVSAGALALFLTGPSAPNAASPQAGGETTTVATNDPEPAPSAAAAAPESIPATAQPSASAVASVSPSASSSAGPGSPPSAGKGTAGKPAGTGRKGKDLFAEPW